MEGVEQLDPHTGEPVRVIRTQDSVEVVDQTAEQARQAKIDAFIGYGMKRWTASKEGSNLQRTRSYEEVEFNSGKHWDSATRADRDFYDRVTIEVNRTPQYLNQVANEQRMTRPRILVKPIGDQGDPETAQIKQGLIRAIERRSDAEAIRDDAFNGILEKGWTYWRVNLEWENERSRRQTMRTARIANDFAVYDDPSAQEDDASDADFKFIVEDIPRERYSVEHPKSKLASATQMVALGDEIKDWISDKGIRVAEYWYKVRTLEPVYALADNPLGDGKFEDELSKDNDGRFIGVAVDDRGEYISRMSTRVKVYWAKINAVEVLDGNDDKTAGREIVKNGKYIPIIRAIGRKALIDKRVVYMGMVRDAIEPCLAADFWLSTITEMVAMGPKAPWVIAYEAVSSYREMWDKSNTENFAALYWDHKDANGDPLPAPFRSFGEAPVEQMKFILQFADEDLKRVMGIYNRSLGGPGPEHSGAAIMAVQRESDVANYHYIDNLKRGINLEAKIYLDWMCKIYDEEQVVQIIRANDEADIAIINKKFQDKTSGEDKFYDMTADGYDTEVEVGPGFNTQRQEALNAMLEYIKMDPGAAPYIGDLIAAMQDSPHKSELVQRLRARVPPGVLQNTGSGMDKVPPAFKAAYDQQAQQLETVTKMAQEAHDALVDKERTYKHERDMLAMKLASEERQAALKAETSVLIKELEAKSAANMEMLRAAIAKINDEIAEIRKPGPVEQSEPAAVTA